MKTAEVYKIIWKVHFGNGTIKSCADILTSETTIISEYYLKKHICKVYSL